MTVSVKLTRRHNLGNYEHAEITVGLEAPVAEGQSAEEVLGDVVGILRPFTALAVIEGAAPVRPRADAVQAQISTNVGQPAPAADPLASQPAPKTRASRKPVATTAGDPLAAGAGSAPTAAATTGSDPLAAGATAPVVGAGDPLAAGAAPAAGSPAVAASPASPAVGATAPSPSDPLAAGGGGVKTSPQLIGEITTLIASDPVLNTAALDYLAKKEKARVRDLSDADKIALLGLLKSL